MELTVTIYIFRVNKLDKLVCVPLWLLGASQKADFLIIHLSINGYVAYAHIKMGFISKLVDIFLEELNEYDLDKVLLTVISKIEYRVGAGQYYKQMSTVDSRMRDVVWLIKANMSFKYLQLS